MTNPRLPRVWRPGPGEAGVPGGCGGVAGLGGGNGPLGASRQGEGGGANSKNRVKTST